MKCKHPTYEPFVEMYNISVRKNNCKQIDKPQNMLFIKERYNNNGTRRSIFVQITHARRVFERADSNLAANFNIYIDIRYQYR